MATQRRYGPRSIVSRSTGARVRVSPTGNAAAALAAVAAIAANLPPTPASAHFWLDFRADSHTVAGAAQANFAAALTALGAGSAFTRGGSNHWYVNASGVLANAAADTPRIGYDPATLDKLGLIYEGAASALWPYSMIPGAVAGGWYYSATNVTVAGAVVTGIDGTTSGGTIKETSATGTHMMSYYEASATVATGQKYPVKVWFKGLSRTKFRFHFIALMGVPGTVVAGFTPVDVDLAARSVSAGWELVEQADGMFTIECLATATGNGAAQFMVQIRDDAGRFHYAGNAAKGMVLGAVQLEQGLRSTSYIHRAGSGAASRSADVLALLIPAGCPKVSVQKFDGQYVVFTVTPGAVWTLDPAQISGGVRAIIGADMSPYATVDSISDENGNPLTGDVQVRQRHVKGLRPNDRPAFAGLDLTDGINLPGGWHIYSDGAFLDISTSPLTAFTQTPRGVREGFNCAPLAQVFNNSTARGPDCLAAVINLNASHVEGDTALATATDVTSVTAYGNEVGNGLLVLLATNLRGNMAMAGSGGLNALYCDVEGQQAGRYHGGLRTYLHGTECFYGDPSSLGTLTDCFGWGYRCGYGIKGNRVNLILVGNNVAARSLTDDHYMNLWNVFRMDLATGLLAFTKQDGSAAELQAGGLALTATATTAPASAQVRMFRKDDTIRQSVGMVEPDGTQTIFGASPFFTDVVYWLPAASGTGVTLMRSVNLTATGTATAVGVANTTPYLKAMGIEYLDTVASTSACGGFRHAVRPFSTDLGFTLAMSWGPATGVSNTTQRAFCGMANSIAAPSDVEPSSQIDIIGMGWDAADTNVQIMHNDGSGTATKIDLGASFPVPTANQTQLYDLHLRMLPGASSVTYLAVNRNTGATATGTISTNLPAGALTIRGYCSAGGTSSVAGIGFKGCVVEVPRG